jgi:hypothetical protein
MWGQYLAHEQVFLEQRIANRLVAVTDQLVGADTNTSV